MLFIHWVSFVWKNFFVLFLYYLYIFFPVRISFLFLVFDFICVSQRHGWRVVWDRFHGRWDLFVMICDDYLMIDVSFGDNRHTNILCQNQYCTIIFIFWLCRASVNLEAVTAEGGADCPIRQALFTAAIEELLFLYWV